MLSLVVMENLKVILREFNTAMKTNDLGENKPVVLCLMRKFNGFVNFG
jgi:hypothetical protein